MSEFTFLYRNAGIKTETELAQFFHVSNRTIINWKKKEPPYSVKICLELMAGKLDALGKPWQGFRLTPSAIESPEGDFIYHYEVRAIRYVYQAAGIERYRICNMMSKQPSLKNLTAITPKRKLKKKEQNIINLRLLRS